MSKFIDSLNKKLKALKDIVLDAELDESIEEILSWVEDEQGTDLDDLITDFDQEDFREAISSHELNFRVIKLADINAEADFEDLLQEFKQKYILTEIY